MAPTLKVKPKFTEIKLLLEVPVAMISVVVPPKHAMVPSFLFAESAAPGLSIFPLTVDVQPFASVIITNKNLQELSLILFPEMEPFLLMQKR